MQNYEFRIYGARGAVSLIMHSMHFSDPAALHSARTFARDQPFEVWRGLENIAAAYAASRTPTSRGAMPSRSAASQPIPLSSNAPPQLSAAAKTKTVYDFKLSAPGHEPLMFTAMLTTVEEAAEHARRLIKRHSKMTRAEIWRGMKLIRQV